MGPATRTNPTAAPVPDAARRLTDALDHEQALSEQQQEAQHRPHVATDDL